MEESVLLKEFRRLVEFPDKDYLRLLPLMDPLHLKKGDHAFKAGELADHVYFIEKGCMRQYYINSNGDERIIYFQVEGGWCSELASLLHNTPTDLNLQALEDCDLLVINRKNWLHAITHIEPFVMYFLMGQQPVNTRLKKRLAEATVETPEEKYMRFLKEEPHLLQRVPLFHIAAYLGMTPETLSRIRKKLVSK